MLLEGQMARLTAQVPEPLPCTPLLGTQLTSCPWKSSCGSARAGRSPSCGSGRAQPQAFLASSLSPSPGPRSQTWVLLRASQSLGSAQSPQLQGRGRAGREKGLQAPVEEGFGEPEHLAFSSQGSPGGFLHPDSSLTTVERQTKAL